MPAIPDAVRVSGDWAYRAQTSGMLGTLQKFPITARKNAILLDISIPNAVYWPIIRVTTLVYNQ